MQQQIDYAELGDEVAAWQESYVQHIGDTQGEEFAQATAADLVAKPWLALQWYVADMMPREQKAGAPNP